MDSREILERELASCIDAQMQMVAEWHMVESDSDMGVYSDASGDVLLRLVLHQHRMNFLLWHVEDVARRKDVDSSVIADCKRRIDILNQRRNDAMEEVDAYLVTRLARFLPQSLSGERVRYNTESLGMAIDRLSILALKIFHMAEQVNRADADEEHRIACAAKLMSIEEQRTDLATAVFDLIEDFYSGVKWPRGYNQFKMYNDPALNPELYAKGNTCRTHVSGEAKPPPNTYLAKGSA